MISAVESQGKRMFSSEEFLTASQVAGFFSRLAAKKSLFNDDDQILKRRRLAIFYYSLSKS